jgi:4-aminobutyrate aminotransferase-like enzyme
VLRKRLDALAERHEIIGEVRGLGLLLGIEFVADRKTRKPYSREARVTDRIVAHMRQNNVLVAAGVALANFGKDGDHIQISPPFTITEAEIAILVEALDQALLTVVREL